MATIEEMTVELEGYEADVEVSKSRLPSDEELLNWARSNHPAFDEHRSTMRQLIKLSLKTRKNLEKAKKEKKDKEKK